MDRKKKKRPGASRATSHTHSEKRILNLTALTPTVKAKRARQVSPDPSDRWTALEQIKQPSDAATVYAGLGLHPISVHGVAEDSTCTCGKCEPDSRSRGKHPTHAKWQAKAFDATSLDYVLKANPQWNIGIRTGIQPNGRQLIVIDIDGPKTLLDEIQGLHGQLPKTLEAQTGSGGTHLYYWVPPGKEMRNSQSLLAPKVDVRGIGGQAVAPPSRHHSGGAYRWSTVMEPAMLPTSIADAIVSLQAENRSHSEGRKTRAKAVRSGRRNTGKRPCSPNIMRRARKYIAKMDPAISGEGGHDATWAVARKCAQDFGLNYEQTLELLREYNSRCVPPWSDTELEHKAREAVDNAYVSCPVDQPWHSMLQRGRDGCVRPTLGNVMTILTHSIEWQDVVAFDELAWNVISLKAPPVRPHDAPQSQEPGYWNANDTVRTATWLASKFDVDVSTAIVDQAIEAIAQRNVVHPIREYLRSLKWDNKMRLPTMFHDYFGAVQSEYTETVGIRAMTGCVARIMQPGCKLDTVVVLEGAQGARKSTAIRTLAKRDEWYSDSSLALGDKDGYQNLRGVWLQEIAELAAIKGAKDTERYKAYLSAQQDKYRPSYGRRSVIIKRHCVFWATTNDLMYLSDATGNRRFWPVSCGEIDIEKLREDVDQLWAEAVERYDYQEPWWLDSRELTDIFREQASARELSDPWESLVTTWLHSPEMHMVDDGGRPITKFAKPADGISTTDILLRCLDVPKERIDKRSEMRVANVLRSLGWYRKRVRVGSGRQWRYFPPEVGR